MTKEINRLACSEFSSHLCALHHASASRVSSISLLNRHCRAGPIILFISTLSSTEAARCFSSRRNRLVLFLSDFPFASRRTRLHCFSPRFITSRLTNPRQQPIVVDANRCQRLRVTNVSGPIDVGSLLFGDRSLLPTIVKFDEK